MNFCSKYSVIIFFFCLYCFSSCKKQKRNISVAFYYWKTNVQLTGFEDKRLDSLHCKKLYTRFFDIDWNAETNEPEPIAVNNFRQPANKNYNYIPVIFITQDVMNKISRNDEESFVKNFTNLLYEKCVQANIDPTEIQIDCDWTINNKDKYFYLLNLCKKQNFFKSKTLSCTIRLYQIRSSKAVGIPPVDKGLLMCYNMGNIRLSGNNNSILDVAISKKYLGNLKNYPINLDVALPLFSWSLLYDNHKRFTGILRGIAEQDLQNNYIFSAKGNNLYQVKKDTIWRGYNLKNNETIRYERCSTDNLNNLATFVSANMNNSSFCVIFYHCDSAILSKYNNYELEKILHHFD